MRSRLASWLVLTTLFCCAAHAGPDSDLDYKHIPYEPAPAPAPIPVPAPAPRPFNRMEKVVENRSFILRDETSNDGGYLSSRFRACDSAKEKLRDYLENNDRCATASEIPARARVLEANASGFFARCSCDQLGGGSDCFACSARGEVRCDVTYEIYRLVPVAGYPAR